MGFQSDLKTDTIIYLIKSEINARSLLVIRHHVIRDAFEPLAYGTGMLQISLKNASILYLYTIRMKM